MRVQKQNTSEKYSSSPDLCPFLFGHEKQEKLFLSLSHSSHLPHAWILSGIKGIGKASFAFRLACWLLGAKPDAHYGLLGTNIEDSICHKVLAGTHDHFLYICKGKDEKTGRIKEEIPVSEIRNLKSFFQKKSAFKSWKIAVIDAVDDLNLYAANALLKILEEPPDRSIFLLVSHQYDLLLSTIKSRAIRCDFKPLNDKDLLKACDKILSSIDFSSDDKARLLSLSKGSPGRLKFLIQEGGYALYQDLYLLFQNLPHPNLTLFKKCTEDISLSAQKQLFFQECFLDLVKKLAEFEFFQEKHSALKKLAKTRTQEEWIDIWYKIHALFLDTKSLKLNFHSSIQTAFACL